MPSETAESTRVPETQVSVPVALFHQMANCFYGGGPGFAELMGFEDPDHDERGSGAQSAGSDEDMDDEPEPPVAVPRVKIQGLGIRGGGD